MVWRKYWERDGLDLGEYHPCTWCGKRHPQKRMLWYDDKWYCSIQHYLLSLNIAQEEVNGIAPVDDPSLDI